MLSGWAKFSYTYLLLSHDMTYVRCLIHCAIVPGTLAKTGVYPDKRETCYTGVHCCQLTCNTMNMFTETCAWFSASLYNGCFSSNLADMMFGRSTLSSDPADIHTRPVATGGGRGGGAQPPWKNVSPPRLPVPFAVTIGIEVYPPPPPGILSAPPPANDTWLRRWLTLILILY